MIHILLLNNNPVVSRLMYLILRNEKDIVLDETDSEACHADNQHYDAVFVDEKCCDAKEMKKILENLHTAKKILFATGRQNSCEEIDDVIMKPFLPSEIMSVLQSIREEERSGIAPKEDGVPLHEERDKQSEKKSDKEYQILDSAEVDKIKQLLFDEELNSTYSHADEESMPESKEDNVSFGVGKREIDMDMDKKLLEAFVKMKPNKIRKMLEGAELNITIRFPKDL